MPELPEGNRSLDILGVRPVASAIEKGVDACIAGAGAFLSRICLPATEEMGLLLRDKVGRWRAANAAATIEKAREIVDALPDANQVHASPRLVGAVIENSSWIEERDIQKMWAGLLASACTADGRDQTNLLFINLLSQMTPAEARMFRWACERAKKAKSEAGWLYAIPLLGVPIETLTVITGDKDVHRLDLWLDHLRELGLLVPDSGFAANATTARMTPTTLALQMYARAEGFNGSPMDFFQFEPAISTPAESRASELRSGQAVPKRKKNKKSTKKKKGTRTQPPRGRGAR